MPFTVQSDATLAALMLRGHATSSELHHDLLKTMPRLSLPSVHRITARLLERGQIGLAPSNGHTLILDARSDVHDHFVCTSCGGIIDLELPESVIATIQEQLGRHLVRDGITIRGHCESCSTLTNSATAGSGHATQPA